MKKYKINLTQTYMQDYTVTIQIESDLSPDEIESQISDLSSEWRLARLSEEELISSAKIDGYVKGSFSTWDGDFDPSSDVSVTVEDEDGAGDYNDESDESDESEESEESEDGDYPLMQLLKELEEEDNQEKEQE